MCVCICVCLFVVLFFFPFVSIFLYVEISSFISNSLIVTVTFIKCAHERHFLSVLAPQSLWNKFFQDKELKGMIKQDVLRTSVWPPPPTVRLPFAESHRLNVFCFSPVQVPRDSLLPGRRRAHQADRHPLLLRPRERAAALQTGETRSPAHGARLLPLFVRLAASKWK